MTDFNQLAQRYIDTWNETDEQARRGAVDALFTTGARYADPLVVVEGRDAITATIGAVQQQFPGFTFRLAGTVDAHHDQVRFTWELTPPGASEALVVGSDVAVCDRDGRISLVLGFLDRVPAAA